MKTVMLGLVALLILGLTACEKHDLFDKRDKKLHDKHGKCGKDGETRRYVYEPLVISEECGCIVQGKVKYVENGETVALVDYGNGECDDIATKTICVDGDCADANVEIIEFRIDCEKEVRDARKERDRPKLR